MISMHVMIPYCSNMYNHELVTYTVLGIIASVAGIIAGTYQIHTWLPYTKGSSDRPKPSSQPHVVVGLSCANIIACFGTFLLCLSFLITEDKWRDALSPCWTAWPVIAQIVANFGYISACLWTLSYLVDVLMQLHNWHCWEEVYYGVCWIGAMVLTTGLQFLRYQHGFHYYTCG